MTNNDGLHKEMRPRAKINSSNIEIAKDLRCPNCGGMLEIVGLDGPKCTICSQSWETYDGILDFSDHDFYWNQIPQKEMQEIIQSAYSLGWKKAVKKYFGNTREYLQEYIVDESRADWHFYIPISADSTVLDVGCGWGAVSMGLARFYKKVFAIDSTIETLKFVNIRARQEGITNLLPIRLNSLDRVCSPFPTSFFNMVVLNGVLEWIGNDRSDKTPRKLQEEALRKVFSLLKSGGYIYIGIENRYYLEFFFGKGPHHELPIVGVLPRKIGNLITKIITGKPHRTYIYSMGGYRNLLSKVGFTQIKFYWPIPSYRFPKTIIPLESNKALKYWKNQIMMCNNLKRIVYKYIPTEIIPLQFLCYSYAIVAKKEKK